MRRPAFINRYCLLRSLILAVGLIIGGKVLAENREHYISFHQEKDYFALVNGQSAAPIFISRFEYPGVLKAGKDLQLDIERVSSVKPALHVDKKLKKDHEVVIIGTIGRGGLVDELISNKKLNVSDIQGKWETYLIQVVEKPVKGIDRALVIAGSDKRGTIFGIYDVSSKIGVSPWYWWADVPAQKHENLYVKPGRYSDGEPKVKYRGIFINDEAPAFSGWAHEKFGGFNSKMYVHVFELILRLKGNYLWPAMWGNAFNDDDPLNPKLADEYGIVVGTSHHEPLMRAHDEWRRYGNGAWNYETNTETLAGFWKKGLERMGAYESIVTIGMRGDGDEPMSEESNIALLEKIVKDQRNMIEEVTQKEASQTPQLWALYKEVQDYFDKGMRVPDDVTLLLCDDNWGNVRRLPKPEEKPRKGGYGMYYHFDYVGGPRNYKWLNTNSISRVWEQMQLTYQNGVDRIWIVNVGDIKPMEFPISFFLDYAWNPDLYPVESIPDYTEKWASKQFGEKYASEIASFITQYTMFNSRRKPELLSPDTYSLLNYREAESVVNDYNDLYKRAKELYKQIPETSKDAYYQLILHPIEACSNLNELYFTVANNWLYAKQGRSLTNEMAVRAEELFERDAAISEYYNTKMAGGKWNHMMDQTHIGYTYWQQPKENVMPEVKNIKLSSGAQMGVALEGSASWWPESTEEPILEGFSPYINEMPFVDIFNRGNQAFEFTLKTNVEWLVPSRVNGEIEQEEKIFIEIDWDSVPLGNHKVPLTILGSEGTQVVVNCMVNKKDFFLNESLNAFVEANGYISIEAENFSKKVDNDGKSWKVIPGLGRTKSGIALFPVTSPLNPLNEDAPHLEYNLYLSDTGNIDIQVYLSPTLNFYNNQGIRYAISIDDDEPQIINMHEGNFSRLWDKWMRENVNVQASKHKVLVPGLHVLKFWAMDPGLVLQKIVINTGKLKPSYLGPPESPLLTGQKLTEKLE